jgi:hypothetical protein
MQILVVTCDRDRWQFQIQCWSFCKYLSHTTINIIVNETNPETWKAWYKVNCRKYLWRHRVRIYTTQDFPEFYKFAKKILPTQFSGGGWKTQQALKLLFSTKTNKPYLVLDTKNWLVQNTKVKDLSKHCRCLVTNPFEAFARNCHHKFNLQEPQFYRPAHTPFWIDPEITNSMFDFFGNSFNASVWLMKSQLPSEFIMYDLYAISRGLDQKDTGTHQDYSKTYWVGDTPPTEQEIQKIMQNKSIKMFSLHLPLLEHMDKKMIERAVGFSTKYFYWRF